MFLLKVSHERTLAKQVFDIFIAQRQKLKSSCLKFWISMEFLICARISFYEELSVLIFLLVSSLNEAVFLSSSSGQVIDGGFGLVIDGSEVQIFNGYLVYSQSTSFPSISAFSPARVAKEVSDV